MINTKWQRTQKALSLLGLFLGVGLPFFLLETNLESWQKVLVLLIGYALIFPVLYWLHKRYANSFVKVVRYDYATADRLIRRELRDQNLPFTRRYDHEQAIYEIRLGKMQLTVDEFMLNLPIDDRIAPEPATKLTLEPETAENAAYMAQLRTSIDLLFSRPQNQSPVPQPAYYAQEMPPQSQQQAPIPVSQFTKPE